MTKHFVAYHNQDKMGQPLSAGDPLRVVSNTKQQKLDGQVVWMFVGETVPGRPRKKFTLGSVFVVDEYGETADEGFRHYARGTGHVFDPPPELTNEPWFEELRKHTLNFRGISEVKDQAAIAALVVLATAAGYSPKTVADA
ncbi:MAG: hypothetical protein WD851_02410 [Pirellulales bacterium]